MAGVIIQTASGTAGGVNSLGIAFTDDFVENGHAILASQQHYMALDAAADLPDDFFASTFVESIQQFMDFTTDGCRLATFYAMGVGTGNNTVTLNIAGSNNGSLSGIIAEVSGLDTLDQTAGQEHVNAGDNNAPETPLTATTTQAEEFLWACVMYDGGGATMTPAGAWSEAAELEAAPINCEYQNVTSAAQYKGQWTLSINRRWMCQISTFKETVSAAAALTGTAMASITETDIVAGGKTVIITLTGDTFIPN